MNAVMAPPTTLDRRHFLGGSDMAALFGVSKWKTPLQIWAEKTGRDAERIEDPARMKVLNRGKRFEPFVIQMAQEDFGIEVTRVNHRFNDDTHPFMSCEIDFEWRVTAQILDALPWLGDLEIGSVQNGEVKTVHPFVAHEWGDEGTDEVPVYYAAQSMHGLAITGRQVCLYAVMVGSDDLIFYAVKRDQETIDAMVAKAVDFWTNYVVTDTPPDPETFDDLKFLYGRDNGAAIEGTPEILEKLAQYREAKDLERSATERADELKFQIQRFMEPSAILNRGGKPVATWKSQSTSRLDQKALAADHPELLAKYRTVTSTRVFRLKGEK